MNTTKHEVDESTTSNGEQRVSTLVGDRLCIRCCYNLVGQPILREQHYNMLIVRCPECGTVASLQEHPLLGRWAMRWAAVLAGLWILVLLGMWFITTATLYGMTREAAFESLDQAGWGGFWLIVRWSLLLAAYGCIWSLLLPHVRRKLLPLWLLVIVALPAIVAYVTEVGTVGSRYPYGGPDYGQALVAVQLIAIAVAAVPMCLGMLFGRSLARLLVRAALPPRLRGSLAGLWLMDGLSPPPGAGRAG